MGLDTGGTMAESRGEHGAYAEHGVYGDHGVHGDPGAPDIIIITGMSGAGRSTAAKSLEDIGWYVVENLPPGLLPTMIDLADRASLAGGAPLVDVRSRAFSTD